MRIDFDHVYVGTRFNPQRKLSREIFEFYQDQLDNFISHPVRESTQGEEAVALNQSLIEYVPSHACAQEIRSILLEVWKFFASGKTQDDSINNSENIIVR